MTLPKLSADRRLPRVKWPKRHSRWDVLPPPSPEKITRALIDDLLSSAGFDYEMADTLAHRDSYAAAAAYLLQIVEGIGDLVPVLVDLRSPHAPHRLAVRFGVIDSDVSFNHVFAADDLRAIDTPAAKLALIALEAEDHDWKALDRKGRALFALSRVVRRMRSNSI